METVHVAFSDASKTAIETVFCGPQDPEKWPLYEELPSDDARYVDWYKAKLKVAPECVMQSFPVPA